MSFVFVALWWTCCVLVSASSACCFLSPGDTHVTLGPKGMCPPRSVTTPYHTTVSGRRELTSGKDPFYRTGSSQLWLLWKSNEHYLSKTTMIHYNNFIISQIIVYPVVLCIAVLSLPGISRPCLMSCTLWWMEGRCGQSYRRMLMSVVVCAARTEGCQPSLLSSRSMAVLPT